MIILIVKTNNGTNIFQLGSFIPERVSMSKSFPGKKALTTMVSM
jgi:hypothetical protein